MRVSVVIGTRDRSHLLCDALNGALAQDHDDVEIIVVDDGSSVEHAPAIEKLLKESPRPVHLITLPRTVTGSGPSHVRNTGIKAATGDLLAFCDDDDYWTDPSYLSHAVRAFQQTSELDLLFGNQMAKSGEKIEFGIWQPVFSKRIANRNKSGETIAVTAADCLCCPGDFTHLNTLVCRRELAHRIGMFAESLRYCEDMDFYVRAIDGARRIAYLPRDVSMHRIPVKGIAANASTRVDTAEKQLVWVQIGHRLLQFCSGPEAYGYAKVLIGSAARRLAKSHAAAGSSLPALYWARVSLLAQPSIKWIVYTALLVSKALMNKLSVSTVSEKSPAPEAPLKRL